MTSRGLRNFNPGNIDYDPKVNWQGSLGLEVGVPNPRFIRFSSAQYGIRAIAKVLLTYQNHDGCRTPRAVISRWAPASENNTGAYISAICASLKAAGYSDDPDAVIDLDIAAVMDIYVRAIILHEEGLQPYTDALIAEGIRLAGVADAKPAPLVTQKTFQAQVGGAVAVAGAAATHVASYAPTVKGWADQLGDYAGDPIVQHAVTVLLTVAGGLAIVGIASQVLKQKAA